MTRPNGGPPEGAGLEESREFRLGSVTPEEQENSEETNVQTMSYEMKGLFIPSELELESEAPEEKRVTIETGLVKNSVLGQLPRIAQGLMEKAASLPERERTAVLVICRRINTIGGLLSSVEKENDVEFGIIDFLEASYQMLGKFFVEALCVITTQPSEKELDLMRKVAGKFEGINKRLESAFSFRNENADDQNLVIRVEGLNPEQRRDFGDDMLILMRELVSDLTSLSAEKLQADIDREMREQLNLNVQMLSTMLENINTRLALPVVAEQLVELEKPVTELVMGSRDALKAVAFAQGQQRLAEMKAAELEKQLAQLQEVNGLMLARNNYLENAVLEAVGGLPEMIGLLKKLPENPSDSAKLIMMIEGVGKKKFEGEEFDLERKLTEGLVRFLRGGERQIIDSTRLILNQLTDGTRNIEAVKKLKELAENFGEQGIKVGESLLLEFVKLLEELPGKAGGLRKLLGVARNIEKSGGVESKVMKAGSQRMGSRLLEAEATDFYQEVLKKLLADGVEESKSLPEKTAEFQQAFKRKKNAASGLTLMLDPGDDLEVKRPMFPTQASSDRSFGSLGQRFENPNKLIVDGSPLRAEQFQTNVEEREPVSESKLLAPLVIDSADVRRGMLGIDFVFGSQLESREGQEGNLIFEDWVARKGPDSDNFNSLSGLNPNVMLQAPFPLPTGPDFYQKLDQVLLNEGSIEELNRGFKSLSFSGLVHLLAHYSSGAFGQKIGLVQVVEEGKDLGLYLYPRVEEEFDRSVTQISNEGVVESVIDFIEDGVFGQEQPTTFNNGNVSISIYQGMICFHLCEYFEQSQLDDVKVIAENAGFDVAITNFDLAGKTIEVFAIKPQFNFEPVYADAKDSVEGANLLGYQYLDGYDQVSSYRADTGELISGTQRKFRADIVNGSAVIEPLPSIKARIPGVMKRGIEGDLDLATGEDLSDGLADETPTREMKAVGGSQSQQLAPIASIVRSVVDTPRAVESIQRGNPTANLGVGSQKGRRRFVETMDLKAVPHPTEEDPIVTLTSKDEVNDSDKS